jgi:hypothetical protein
MEGDYFDEPYDDEEAEAREPDLPEAKREDPYLEQAKLEIEDLFEAEPKQIVYERQLEVQLERQFFHWVTARAVEELVGEGRLGREQRRLRPGSGVSFLFEPRMRYRRRIINRKLRVLREYAEAASGRVRIGDQAELLFLAGFVERGFVCRGREVKEYGGKRWEATGHDLDYLLEGEGGVWGCEVKNRMEYMEAGELDVKVRMCQYLGVRPLFVLRCAPKTHIERVRQAGGYTMVFQTQIWPSGQEGLVQRVQEELGLPLDCPRAVPSGIFERFLRWVGRK